MISTLAEFVEELRAVGIPVSMVEALDAAEALQVADLSSPEGLRAALGATMVKNARHYPAFDATFDVFFGLRAAATPTEGEGPSTGPSSAQAGAAGGGGGSGEDEVDALRAAILAAVRSGDDDALRRLLAVAVDRLAGMEPGRPVGGRYHLYRVLRRLDRDLMLELLRAEAGHGTDDDPLADRLAEDAARRSLERIVEELRAEILRRLVADRGAAAVARTLRTPLVEDLDLMHATRDEIDRIERAVAPLARKLATRIAGRRKHGDRGRLDVRRTIRRSLAHGGTLLDPRFRPPRRSKPELVLLCDVSGSMATFARFTMQLTYAISSEFSRVRTFAFIDELDEVTGYLDRSLDFADALATIQREAELVRTDGHSDYGSSFVTFGTRYRDAVTPRTTVLVTGDARNNYRDTGVDVFAELAQRARAVFWLNPEAERYWDTGDSVMSVYAPWCDRVEHVRTLRQLERFVEEAALPSPGRRSRIATA